VLEFQLELSAPVARAMGIIPKIMARVVIRIGLKRSLQASIKAAFSSTPLAFR